MVVHPAETLTGLRFLDGGSYASDRYNPLRAAIGNALLDVDTSSHDRLTKEVLTVVRAGYPIEISDFKDPAFEDPVQITETYSFLSDLDSELAEERQRLVRDGVGNVSLLPPWTYRSRQERQIFKALEPKRNELLFRPEVSNAGPWHDQRGRATALLTISAAHDLRVEGESDGIYPTMSGPLDKKVTDYVFDGRSNLKGLSLGDALMFAETRFFGSSPEKAQRRTDTRLQQLGEFVEAPVSPMFKQIVRFCTDGLGIRDRKGTISNIAVPHLAKLAVKGEIKDPIVSYGSGTALPVFEAMRELRDNYGVKSKIIAIDLDPAALAAAALIAEKFGLGDSIQTHCLPLFSKFGRPLPIGDVLRGQKVSLAENAGFAEYVPSPIFAMLLKTLLPHMAENGLLVTANMLNNRPQKEFLQGMMGWGIPIHHRDISRALHLHRLSGIPPHATNTTVTSDGSYGVYSSYMNRFTA